MKRFCYPKFLTFVQKDELANDVATIIGEMIVHGRIKHGLRLVETEVAEWFGISRTPVGEAFIILDSRTADFSYSIKLDCI